MASLGISTSMRKGNVPFEVTFEADVLGLDIDSWFWEFGDGFSSRKANPTHVYRDPGKFDVRLTVIDTAGIEHVGFESQLITVFKVTINSTKPKGDAPLEVKFSVTEYLPEGYQIDSYLWDFADGSDPSTDASPVHNFQNPGNYPVTVSTIISRI